MYKINLNIQYSIFFGVQYIVLNKVLKLIVRFFFQFLELVDVISVFILWRKKGSDVDFFIKFDSVYGFFYLFNVFEVNIIYEIQVQIMSGSYLGLKSILVFVTIKEEQDGM